MVACAPWGAAGEFAASRHGALTRSQAAERGISKRVVERLLRDAWIDERAPGVLVVRGAPPTWQQRMYVATQAGGGVGVAAFRSAAALHGFDGYGPGPVELLLPSGRRQYIDDAIHHRGPMGGEHALDFTEVDGIRCTGIARTLCDLGSVDSKARVAMAFESAWRNGHSLTWMRQTAERLHRPGQSGTGVLLRLLDSAQTRATPTESALEVRVERALAGVPGIVRQFSIFDARGRFVARADFAIPALKIAIEAHSRQFHFGSDSENHDSDREERMTAEGWIVRYVTRAQASNARVLCSSIRALIKARQSA
ncbi:MAG TPA: AbiEi antitoxin N-terminal domain-containing protein [Ilumatobacteraceae bacterium]|nr:AbiEi antitoxin N-terminal domain-containing protein [Ilumatobacteraceae bacterium]